MVRKDFEGVYEYFKEYKFKKKRIVLEHYSKGSKMSCSCCGEKQFHFLILEHINGGGNKERKKFKNAGITLWNHLIKEGFPKGYDVLCYNCNICSSHMICPHKTNK